MQFLSSRARAAAGVAAARSQSDRPIVRAASAAAAIIATVALVVSLAGPPWLARFGSETAETMPLTALACLVGALALALRASASAPRRRLGRRLGVALSIAAGATLAAYAGLWHPALAPLQARLPTRPIQHQLPHLPSAGTAVALLGVGVALATTAGAGRVLAPLRRAGAAVAWMLAYTAIVGHVLGVDFRSGPAAWFGIAMPSAIALSALALGALAIHPASRVHALMAASAPAALLRAMLLAGAVAPLPLALCAWAVAQGTQADPHLGYALFAVGSAVVTSVVALVTARTLGRVHRARLAGTAAAERRRASADRDRLFHDIAATTPLVLFRTDPAGHVVWVNDRWREWSGQTEAGKMALEVVHPEDRRRVARGFARAVAAGDEWHDDYRIARPDGTVRWLGCRTRPVHDDAGTVTGFVGTCVDVTDRRRVEQELRRRSREMTTLVEGSPDAIYRLDRTHRLQYANAALERLLGTPPGAAVGKTVAELGLESPASAVHDRHAERAFETGEEQAFDVAFVLPDGQERSYRCRLVPERDASGGVDTLLGVATDVTVLRRADADARRFAAVAQSIDDAIMATDVSGRLELWSAGAERLFGWTAGEVLGRALWTFLVPAGEVDAARAAHGAVARGGHVRTEAARLHRDGTPIDVGVNLAPIRDDRGAVVGVSVFLADIRTETRLRRSLAEVAARWRLLVDAVPGLVWVEALDGVVQFVNATWCRYTGQTPEEARGDGWCTVANARDVARLREASAAAAEPGQPGRGEVRYRRHDGAWRWHAVTSVLLPTSEGRPPAWLGIALDIEDRKQAERRLAQLEERMRLATDAAGIGLWFRDLRDDQLAWTVRCKALFGIPADASMSRERFLAAIHPDDRARVTHAIEAAIRDRDLFAEDLRAAHARDGGERWIAMSGRATYDDESGDAVSMHGVAIDVTDRKRAQAARDTLLRMSEDARTEAEAAARLLQSAQEVADLALLDLPFQRFLEEALQRLRRRLDADAAVLLLRDLDADGRPPAGADALHVRAAVGVEGETSHPPVPFGEGFAGRIAAERRPLVWSGDALAEARSPWVAAMGLRALAGVPLFGGETEPVLGVLHVGTRAARRFHDRELDHLRFVGERIALAIAQAAARDAERQALERARAASRAKDEFLAVLSHELRSPLHAMVNWLALLRRPGLPPAKQADALARIDRNVQAQTQLVNDLLDVSRIVAGKLAIEHDQVDLQTVVEEAVATVRPAADARGVALALDVPDVIAPVLGDRGRLQQVLVNLLVNAVKFTKPGGHVACRLATDDGQAVVRVVDDGIGIAPDVLPRLFDRFVQADLSSTRPHGGLGLGLAIVRHLVREHGGDVTAESAGLGHGATFTVRLPLAGESRPLLPPPASVERTPPARRAHVLLVEDDTDTRDALVLALESAGFVVDACGTATEAEAAFARGATDAIVSDVGLPGRDGHWLMRRLRERAPRLPAIAMTGFAGRDDVRRALDAGFTRHVGKPVEPDVLVRMLDELLAGADAPPTWH